MQQPLSFFIGAKVYRMKKNMQKCHEEYEPFLDTLKAYQRAGVSLTVKGRPVSARDLADLCVVREAGSYMGDYIQDNRGKLVEIRFDKIDNE